MADSTLLTVPVGPGTTFFVLVDDSSAEPSPQASPVAPSFAALEAAASRDPSPATENLSPAINDSEKMKDVEPAEEQAPKPAHAPLPLPRRRAPPKQRPGTFVQSWQFSFEPLMAVKEGGTRGAPLPAEPAPKKKTARRIHAISINASPSEPIAASNPEEAAAVPTRRAGSYRRQHGAIHTPRVDFLLKKYLGDRSQEIVEPTAAVAGQVATPVLPPAAKAIPLPVPGLKRIVQVKAEQDAAIAAIKSKSRQFRARPVPLEVAETTASRVTVTAAAVVLQEGTNTAPTPPRRRSSVTKAEDKESEQQWQARPVPPSSAEPRYAEIVADSVLRRYSHNEISGEVGEAKGLHKWMSWPGEQAEATALVTAAAAVPPARPQSARPRGSSFGGHTALHLPEIVEESDEMKI